MIIITISETLGYSKRYKVRTIAKKLLSVLTLFLLI